MRAGLFVAPERDLDQGERYEHMSLPDVAKELNRIDGKPITDPIEAVRAALASGSLGDVLADTSQAVFLNAYRERPDSTAWAKEGSASNYLQQQRYRPSVAPNLDPRPRGTEANIADVSATGETFKIAEYAKRFEVDEQDILADKLDAITEVIRGMASAANRLRPDLVYSLLLANGNLADATALFASGRGNLGEAGSALSAATLGTGIAAIQNTQQWDADRNAIALNIPAAHLVVPPDLKVTAAGILNGIRLGQGDDLVLHAEARIGSNGVINPTDKTSRVGTATNWFLFAPKVVANAIEVVYLHGKREPSINRYALEEGRWGVGFAVRHSIGAIVIGWRGCYKATGAA